MGDKLLMFSRNADSFTQLRFAESLAKQGIEFICHNDLDYYISFEGGNLRLLNQKDEEFLKDPEIKWVIFHNYLRGKWLIESLVRIVGDIYPDKYVLNAKAYQNQYGGYNKLTQQVMLKKAGVNVVDGIVTPNVGIINRYIQENEKTIIKPLSGSLGFGIRRAKKEVTLEATPEFVPAEYVIQREVPADSDYRVIVIGGKAIAAMKRNKNNGNVVSNYSAGNTVEAVDLNEDIKSIAEAAAIALGLLDYAGIDIIENEESGELIVLEGNRFPQFEGFESVTGLDIPGILMEHLKNLTKSE